MAEVINREQNLEVETMVGGTTTEAIARAGAIALTILGLANVLPLIFLAIPTIAVGGGLLFQGQPLLQDILTD